MAREKRINNDFYHDLGEGWYDHSNHPVALLRAENAARIPWVAKRLSPGSKVLDVGCGAGLLANALAKMGHQVTGIDLSETSLTVAKAHDETKSANYLTANAYSLPFQNNEFDAVCAMDVLEHVEEPHLLIGEAARVLKPKGVLFFHTFNRTLLSYLMVIKGVEWCVQNTPRNMHVYPLFIKPRELEDILELHKMRVQDIWGFRPEFSRAFWKMCATRKVPSNLRFRFCRSLRTGYCGFARKCGSLSIY
jgi:2-polyprenyl-6-hydroxyphenyl methylase/3-demethylubiquinone-9 3-methyltransferase